MEKLSDAPGLQPALAGFIFATRWLQAPLYFGLIGISSIHLLKTFINAPHMTEATIKWQVLIHLTFVVSALAMAYTDRIATVQRTAH